MPFFVVNCNFCFNMQVVPAILRDSPSLSVNNTATQPNAPLPAAYLHGYQSPAGATAAASPPPLPARGAQQRAPAAALSGGIAAATTHPPWGTQHGRTGCPERPPKTTASLSSLVGSPVSQAAMQPPKTASARQQGKHRWSRIRPGANSAEAANAPRHVGSPSKGQGRFPACVDVTREVSAVFPRAKPTRRDSAEAWEDARDAGSLHISRLL